MPTRHLAISGLVILSSAGILAAQTATHQAPGDPLVATTDCRAGCNKNFNGCQESSQSAVFNASPGYYLRPDSVKRIGMRKGNPGLRSEPEWVKERFPEDSETPESIIVSPNLATCHGEHPHTQGINYYDFQVLQAKLPG